MNAPKTRENRELFDLLNKMYYFDELKRNYEIALTTLRKIHKLGCGVEGCDWDECGAGLANLALYEIANYPNKSKERDNARSTDDNK